MRTLILILSMASALLAQTSNNATVTAHAPGGRNGSTQTIIITLRDRTVLVKMGCDVTTMEPGQSTTCHLALNQATLASLPVTLTVPDGFSAVPTTPTFAAGSIVVDFTLTREDITPATPLAQLPILPSVMNTWQLSVAAKLYAEVMVPCCARVDHCGYPVNRISTAPCQ